MVSCANLSVVRLKKSRQWSDVKLAYGRTIEMFKLKLAPQTDARCTTMKLCGLSKSMAFSSNRMREQQCTVGAGGARAPYRKAWFIENPGEIPENSGTFASTPVFYLYDQWDWLIENVWIWLFFSSKKVFMLFMKVREEKTCREKVCRTIFRGGLGKLGQKSFAPPKICLLPHLCVWTTRKCSIHST